MGGFCDSLILNSISGEVRGINMLTEHRVFIKDAREASELDDASIDIAVTSPPYPMISMWDDLFMGMNGAIGHALEKQDGRTAYALMHGELDRVWEELYRVLKEGAFACINIGDAVRTLGDRFQLYSNHARIQEKMFTLGFDLLPVILWRKQTNVPNKFMGSGMLPAGAYVTLEHEYILIFRKGAKRAFHTAEEKLKRQQSAFFWEERNAWYSDLWDFKGTRQEQSGEKLRKRSGAFPLLLPLRLINMYSQIGDTVLDPFLGTGTTTLAAMACGRNSVGYELDGNFAPPLREKMLRTPLSLNSYNLERLKAHHDFVFHRTAAKGPLKYCNEFFDFPVMTAQEQKMKLVFLKKVEELKENHYRALYLDDEKARKFGAGIGRLELPMLKQLDRA